MAQEQSTQADPEAPVGVGAHPAGGLLNRLRNLPPPAIYATSLIITNAFSFLTVPLMAAYVEAGTWGQFDISLSIVEGVTLIAGLGIAAQLIRFGSTAETPEDETKVARELLGVSLLTFVIFSTVVQLLTPMMAQAANVELGLTPLRLMLLAGCTAAIVELPLMWIRMKDRAWHYLIFAVGRTLVGVALMIWVLEAGHGIEGVMISNGLVMTISSLVAAYVLGRETGVSLSKERFLQVATYGAPIVGAALCMFLLGNSNRLFMSGDVTDAEIAHFGMAQRFAIAMYLLYAPFELWWTPKRIAMLKEKDGLRQSAEYWSLGVAVLLLSVGAIALTAPIFVELALNEDYAGSSAYVPALLAATALHYLVLLTNVGVYARETGFTILKIDIVGALVALGGYVLLIPEFGGPGALAAMFAGNLVRLALYIVVGRAQAPIVYPWLRAGLGLVATALVIWMAPPPEEWVWRLIYSVFAGLALLTAIAALRLMRPIEEPVLQMMGLRKDVRSE